MGQSVNLEWPPLDVGVVESIIFITNFTREDYPHCKQYKGRGTGTLGCQYSLIKALCKDF